MASQQHDTQIRTLIDTYLGAIRRKDLAGLMSCYAEDVVAFDLMPPLQYAGKAGYQKLWKEGFDMTEGPFAAEFRDLAIHAGADVGFACALEHIKASTKTGDGVDMWVRWTAGFRRIGDGWKIVHEHSSSPIDMVTNKALLDLKP